MNNFGNIFKISIFGESHGDSVGVLIDGMPAGVSVQLSDFTNDLAERKGGACGTTARIENDVPILSSGIYNGKTTGSPISIRFANEHQDSDAYPIDTKYQPRPGHADFPAFVKYGGFSDHRGGGHFSGRLTLGLIAAGVFAKKIIPCTIKSEIIEIHGKTDYNDALKNAVEQGDSLGGIIQTTIKDVPIGLGEPFFGSIESMISSAVFSIPGAKGIEFGAGFRTSSMLGSEYNDIITDISGSYLTNNSGGINGGLSNGNDIVFRTAFHPSSSIAKSQNSIDLRTGEKVEISTRGRHDACFVLRVSPVVSAVSACVFADLMMSYKLGSVR